MMGRKNDTMAVVGNHANVYSVRGLKVVDASSLPFCRRATPNRLCIHSLGRLRRIYWALLNENQR